MGYVILNKSGNTFVESYTNDDLTFSSNLDDAKHFFYKDAKVLKTKFSNLEIVAITK